MIRLLAFLLTSLLVLTTSSWAAITFVNTTDATATQTVTSLTTSRVVPSGTNQVLIACIQTSGDPLNGIPSTVVFNTSESFTKVRADKRDASPGWQTDIWYLVNPTATTANIVITYVSNANVRAVGATFPLFAGVDQANPIDAQAGGTGLGTTLSASITTVAANAWVVDCAIGRDDAGLTVGSGQTSRSNRTGGTNVEGMGMSTVDGKASPGVEVMDWTQTSSEWAISAVSLTPASAGGGTALQQSSRGGGPF